jgi:hypothetical protein
MPTVDDYVLPPDVTPACIDAPRASQSEPSDIATAGTWKG